MITDKEIRIFFESEANIAKANYDTFMALPQKERIRKRKCIAGVHVDPSFFERNNEDDILIKLYYYKNLADFEEGDYLILHEEGKSGFQCTLTEFLDENTVIVSVFPTDFTGTVKELSDKDFVLDKALVDLRGPIFSNFYNYLPSENDFWKNHIVNIKPSTEFHRLDDCKKELAKTIKNFNLSLTEKQKEAVLNSMSAKNLYLIQGPPGTGKSFILALIMLEEMLFLGHKIAIIGPNHMAINNAMNKTVELCNCIFGMTIKIGPYFKAPKTEFDFNGEQKKITNISRINVDYINRLEQPLLFGLTPHALYTSRARGLKFDTLFIDEAGQETIPLAMMAMKYANKVIFAGDHKQLPPIINNDEIPEELKMSIFQRLMKDGNYTMLNKSFRMCGDICDFVSHIFYEDQLYSSAPSMVKNIICEDPLISFDAPVIICNVEDNGQQVSEAEAHKIEEICGKFIIAGLQSNKIGILSPFRAQVAEIRRTIKKSTIILDDAKKDIVVDTIDKMQGQEREVIIVSMTAGDTEYMKEMSNFLYNANKLNVAFSRAKSKLIILGNIKKLSEIALEDFPLIGKIITYSKAKIIN